MMKNASQLLIFDAVVMEHEEANLIDDFASPSIFSDDDYLKHLNKNNLSEDSLNYRIELPLKVMKFSRKLLPN